MITMSSRTAKGETQDVGNTGTTATSGNGRAIKTAPEPPPTIRYGRWFEVGQSYSGTVTKVGTDYDQQDILRTELTLELDAPAVTLYKNERVNLDTGAELVLTISQMHLVPQIEALSPQPGLWLRITWTGMAGRKNLYRVEYDDSAVADVPGKPIRMNEFGGAPREDKASPPPF